MATADAVSKPQDKLSRLKRFAWVKRLTNRKTTSADRGRSPSKIPSTLSPSKAGRSPTKRAADPALSEAPPVLPSVAPAPQTNGSYPSLPVSADGDHARAEGTSIAPTLETNPGTIHSDGDHHSKAGTSHTVGGAMSSASGGGNSIFSSSNHSSHSLSTTLTTIQSAPSGNVLNQHASQGGTSATQNGVPSSHQAQPSQSSSYFQHQYPTTPAAPASAIPAHLNPHSHVPATYRSATANNLLTDNASVLTLASSSNRFARRNSVDTNASIRAIAPSSVWGGSRESLPLSVLSQSTSEHPPAAAIANSPTVVQAPSPTASSAAQTTTTSQQQNRPHSGTSGLAPAERASVYSSSGITAPVLTSERNSIYASKDKSGIDGASLKGTQGQDGSSVRSGLVGHGRSESITGSIGGYSSPLASPKEPMMDE